MKMEEDIRSITYLKARAADLLSQINETHRPVVITQNGEPRAVIQDPQSYEHMRNALGIMKLLAEGELNVKRGKLKKQDEVFENLRKKLSIGKSGNAG